MADEENKCECPCTAWKAGFCIFVFLSVIVLIILLILYLMARKQINEKLKGTFRQNVVQDSEGNTYQQINGGYGELDRILSSTTE